MKFSIILATLNRSNLVKSAIESIINQTYKNFEIIVVDQSIDKNTELVVNNFIKDNRILYFKVNFKGLSKARNYGISKANGEYICLMDDDAEYDNEFLQKAYEILLKNDYNILSGIIKEKETGKVFMPLMNSIMTRIIDYNTVSLCLSASLVIEKKIMLNDIGLFDEKLGAGQYFGAGEESDLLFRFLENGYKIFYTKSLLVYHPYPINEFDETSYKRAYSYALGEGALCKKNIKNSKYKHKFIKRFIVNIIKSSMAILVYCFKTNRRKFYINRLVGLFRGFVEYN